MSLLKSIIPKNTIVGKALAGNTKGAISSALNYVKSGEILQDVKNISTGNVVGIISKANIPGAAAGLLNKQPSPAQVSGNLTGGTTAQSSISTPTQSVYNTGMIPKDTPSTGTASGSNSKDEYTMYYVVGGILAYFLLFKK